MSSSLACENSVKKFDACCDDPVWKAYKPTKEGKRAEYCWIWINLKCEALICFPSDMNIMYIIASYVFMYSNMMRLLYSMFEEVMWSLRVLMSIRIE